MNAEGPHIAQALTEAAFEHLFRQHFKPLCLLAQRYVKDIDMAREIVQETFMQLWDKRGNIDTERGVKSYLGMAVHNKSLNYLRDNRKFDKDLIVAENLTQDSLWEASDSAVIKDISRSIEEAIAELPDKCREVFVMSRYEQLRYLEIADKLGLSVKTVESHMSKALVHMRLRLSEYLTVALLLMYFLRK